jgi:predicted nucleic acid-binding protein
VAETQTGLLDTSVVIDLGVIAPGLLPEQVCVSAVTIAELSAGTHATDDPAERARRQDRLQQLESWVEPLAFDSDCARAYGRIYAAVLTAGRQPRRHAVDLLIAATALAAGLPLYTRNIEDFRGLGDLLSLVAV